VQIAINSYALPHRGTRNVGRQPKRWIDNVKDDVADLGLNMRTAMDSARD